MIGTSIQAQDYLWVNGAGGISNADQGQNVCRDDSNNYYVLAYFQSAPIYRYFTNGIVNDSGIIANPNQQPSQYSTFVLKYTADGLFQWAKKCNYTGSYYGTDIEYANNKLYVIGAMFSNVSIYTKYYFPANGEALIMGLDMNGIITDTIQLPEVNIQIGGFSYPKIRIAKTGEIYVLISNGLNSFYLKKIVSSGFIWDKPFNGNLSTNDFRIYGFDEEDGYIYLYGRFKNNYTIPGELSLTATGLNDMILIKLNSNSNIIWARKFGNTADEIGYFIKAKGNKMIASARLNTGNTQIGNFIINHTSGTGPNELFIGLDTSGNVKWVNKAGAKIGATSLQTQSLDISNKGFFYFGGSMQSNIYFGDYLLTGSTGTNDIFITKLDSTGNFIWAIDGKTPSAVAYGLVVDSSGDCIVTGRYPNNLKLGNLSINSKGQSDLFLVRIQDISITRLPITKKQYCTGDSLYVPYTITGKFKNGNKYTAQLSNNNGNFDTLVSNIGYRLDTLAGTIACKLPDIITGSNQYRIRIVSDSPYVASFDDTAHYSIFQQPKAFAGKDTLICYGQSVQLGTDSSFASTYYWQPALLLNDSSTKKPFAKPLSNINFILTASNNYCIARDTVLVNVRSPLIIETIKDTTLCFGDTLKIIPNLQGGDTLARKIYWFGNNVLLDSIKLYNNFIPDTATNYELILKDGCSLNDTARAMVQVRKKLPLMVSNDTTICSGNSIKLSITGFEPDSVAFHFNWFNTSNPTQSPYSNLTVKPDSSTNYFLVSNYVCDAKPDTFLVKVAVRKPLSVLLPADTTLCNGQTLAVSAKAAGGLTNQYVLQWFNNTTLLATDSAGNFKWYDSTYITKYITSSFSPTSNYLVITHLSDNCTTKDVYDTLQIMVKAPLSVSITGDSSICKGDPLQLKAQGTGGLPNAYRYKWKALPDTNTLSSDSLLFIQAAQQQNYSVTLKDDCSNPVTALKSISLKLKPIADFNLNTTIACQLASVRFTNTSTIAGGQSAVYYWYPGDGTVLFTSSPEYFYKDTGTFDITLKVVQGNACADSIGFKNLVHINPKPIAAFTASPTVSTLLEPDVTFTNLSSSSNSFILSSNWLFGDGNNSTEENPVHKYLLPGLFDVTLIVENNFNCFDTLLRTSYIHAQNVLRVFLPSAFTPNGDNLNDELVPVGIGFDDYEMEIYNRWGALVFKTSKSGKPFTGNDLNNQALPAEVYVCKLMVRGIDGNWEVVFKNVSILR